jgi:hypothetical protein
MRSKREGGEYRYELGQDLRSQLLEEELRNRDRNAALVALEREIERYRPYLHLSPDEALARAKTAPPAEKPLLEKLAGRGWGPLQLYARLSREELVALRAGQELKFSAAPENGERPLTADVGRGVLESLRDWRLRQYDNPPDAGPEVALQSVRNTADPNTLALTALPGVDARVTLRLNPGEPGQFALAGSAGYVASVTPGQRPPDTANLVSDDRLAVGESTPVPRPERGPASARPARDPELRRPVSLPPLAANRPESAPNAPAREAGIAGREAAAPKTRVTSAEVLQALHEATGLPIIADFYTRLFLPEAVTVENQSLLAALNHLAGAMRLRWDRDGERGWLQFRSATYYHDRLKEVPNRRLARWAASWQSHGALTPEDLAEIAQLSDAQLDAAEMAEGAKELWGLAEWELARSRNLRPHLRFLASFSSAQRQEALSSTGLAFTRMSLAQQQQFLALALAPETGGLQSLEELAGATLRVDYSLPGWFEWRVPGPAGYWLQWVMPAGSGRRVPRPPVRERTRAAALQAARQFYAQFREPLLQATRHLQPQFDEAQLAPQEAQIAPTSLDLTFLYIPGASPASPVKWANARNTNSNSTW